MSEPSIFADEALAAFASGPGLGDLDVGAIRAGIDQRAASRTPGPSLPDVHDVDAGGRRGRVYRPFDSDAGPVILWLHGGGWTVGTIEAHDRPMRRLAARSGVAAVSLDYRLAPEHPWPAAVDDTVAALEWLGSAPDALGFRPTRLAVGGDSAGGTLAALACGRLEDEASAALPALQVLAYGNTDLAGTRPSMSELATGFGLDAETVRFFNRQWVPDESRWADPDVSPVYADVHGWPAALIVTAELDPLRDEGHAYAERLTAAGVPVEYRREPGMIHNFLLLDELSPAAGAAADRVADDVGRLLAV